MNDQGLQTETEFVLRRTSGSFSQFLDQVWDSVPLVVVLAAAGIILLAYLARSSARSANPKAGGWFTPLVWLVIAVTLGIFCRRLYQRELTATDAGLGSEFTVSNHVLWYGFTAAVFVLGLVFVVWKYIRERKA